MNLAEIEAFTMSLEDVKRVENFGYAFFFVGDDVKMPFLTTAASDNEYDSVSNLNRDGVFRINLGVSKNSFQRLIANESDSVDYTQLDVFLPHPDYAKQGFVCILNPTRSNVETLKEAICEAHGIAKARRDRKTPSGESAE